MTGISVSFSMSGADSIFETEVTSCPRIGGRIGGSGGRAAGGGGEAPESVPCGGSWGEERE